MIQEINHKVSELINAKHRASANIIHPGLKKKKA